jgi:DNA invertase Pin-like site-specific DNA recombinase
VPVTRGLESCLDYLHAGDVLVVWKRQGTPEAVELIEIVSQLRERGIGLTSATEAVDTTTAMGEFLFHIFSALAQYERSLIRERVNAGLAAAPHRGPRGSQPRRLDGEPTDAALAPIASGMTVSAAAQSVGRSTLNPWWTL